MSLCSRCGRETVYAERSFLYSRVYVRASGGVCTRECACVCVRTNVCVCVFVVTEGMCLLV